MKLLPSENLLSFVNTLQIKIRPNASPGLWLMFLLPFALIISAAMHPVISTSTYKLSSIFSFGIICTSLLLVKTPEKKLTSKVWLMGVTVTVIMLFQICLHRGPLFSIWSGILSTSIYQKLYFFVLQKLPRSFSLGEAAVCTQSYLLLVYFTFISIFENFMKPTTNIIQTSTFIIQVGLIGISLIALVAYIFNIKSTTKFYLLSLSIFVFIVLLPVQILLKKNALLWIIELLWNDLITSKVVLYWSFCSILAVLVITRKIKGAQKASTAVRKVFHILTIAVFLPGLLYNCSLLYLASGVILGIFFILEIMRILDIAPLANHLQNGLVVFGDEKDVGIIAFTPMFLLAGCAVPLWIHPAPCDVTNSAMFNLLPLLSGILTIGVGDTTASIVGSKFGRWYWYGSKKTIEGTAACILSQLGVIFILVYLDFLKFFNIMQCAKVILAVILTSLIEAKTDQVDNLALPFVMYICLILT